MWVDFHALDSSFNNLAISLFGVVIPVVARGLRTNEMRTAVM